MRRLLGVALLVSVAACSLPLPDEVQTVRPSQRRSGGGIQVLPPGPKDGQDPVQIVQGFRDAQANPDGHHAVARQFLTDSAANAWRDDAEVQVYDPGRLTFSAPSSFGGRASVVVSSYVIGQVRPDGSYIARVAAEVKETYGLQLIHGQWRLSSVPPGLRLTSADRERSYLPSSIYYLAKTPAGAPAHLVPDQVFLPVGRDPARTLVQRLLQPPTSYLAGSVTSAFPPGSRLRSVSERDGVVTVDMNTSLIDLPSAARQALSAQLVWTLRGLGPTFTALRLLSTGAPLSVPGVGQVQGAGEWDSYDPEGLGANPPYLFVVGRRLHSSSRLPFSSGLAGLAVDAAALTVDRTRLALLEGVAPGAVTVRTGPLRGPYAVAVREPGLTSPSWGSGQYGLWMLRNGRVVLLPSGGKRLQLVAVGQRGAVQALAVSRDGARAALVIGGLLHVGRIDMVRGAPRIIGVSRVLPELTRVGRVAWASSIELVVIGALTRSPQVVRVAVDGSSVTPVNSSGIKPVGLAASPAGLLVTSGQGVYEGSPRGFTQVQTGSAVGYPG